MRKYEEYVDSKLTWLYKYPSSWCIKRIKDIFGFELHNFYCCDALLFDMKGFDLIIGNPPYGNLLDKELKIKLKDKYGNIALNFINHFYKLLTNNGLLYFIVPHSFSRAGQGALVWRKEIIENKFNPDSKILLAAGRLSPVKNFGELIEIAKEVFTTFDDWQLHIYGDDYCGTKEKLQNKIKKYNLENKIVFCMVLILKN